MFQVEPVLANMNSYTVLVRTPEGAYIHLSSNKAVAGPGFETLEENRTLTRVGDSFTGQIIYTTPIEVAAKLKSGSASSHVPQKVQEIVNRAEKVDWVAGAANGSVATAPPAVEQNSELESKKVERASPTKADPVPSLERLQQLTRNELVAWARAKGIKADGNRVQLISRLGPLASL